MPVYEYKGHEFESDHDLSPEEWTQTLTHLDSLPTIKANLAEKSTEELVGEVANMPLAGRMRKGAAAPVGLAETALQMATGMPAFLTGTAGKLGAMAQGNFTEEGLEAGAEALTPELLHDITYQPRTYAGQLMSRGAGEAFKQAGRGLAGMGAGAKAGVEAALAGEGQSGAQQRFSEGYKQTAPVTQALFETGLIGQGVRSIYQARKTKAEKQLKDTEIEKLREEAEAIRAEQIKPEQTAIPIEQMELGLEPRFGKFGEIAKDVDEFGIPFDRTKSLELQKTERGGDLFSDEAIAVETEARAGAKKASEINQAWEEYKATKPFEEDVFEPSQGGPSKIGFGRGRKQAGAIDKDLLTFGIPRLIAYVRAKGIPEERLVERFKGTYKEEQLKAAIDQSFNPKSRSTLVWMKPEDFLALATKRKPYERDMQGRLAEVKRGSIRMGIEGEGIESIPYLMVRDGPEGAAKVIGHEGRHRMDVFIEKGLELVPVRVQHEMARWGQDHRAFEKAIPQGEEVTTALPIKIDPIFKPEPMGLKKVGHGERGSINLEVLKSFLERFRNLDKDLTGAGIMGELDQQAYKFYEKRYTDSTIKLEALKKELATFGREVLGYKSGSLVTFKLDSSADIHRQKIDKLIFNQAGEIKLLLENGHYISLDKVETRYNGPQKVSPLGQLTKGRGERGSIGFKKEPKPSLSFEEFKAGLPQDLWDVAPELYKRKYATSDLGKIDIAPNTPVVKAIDRLPGLKGLVAVELIPKEDMLPLWKHEKDIPSNVIGDALTSGGRMMALRSNSSYINWSVEKINSAIRDTEVISKKATHDIISASNALKTWFGTKDVALVETMSELMSKEGKDAALNLTSQAQKNLATSIKNGWDNLYKAINEERAARGIGPVEYRPNYLTAIFKGPYRGFVRDNANGNVVGVVAAKTMKEAEVAVAEISRLAAKEGIDVTVEAPAFSMAFSKEGFQKNIGAYYVQMNELMQIMGPEGSTGKAFHDLATQWYDRRVRDHLGYRQHFKSKKGVYGAEGNKPWKDMQDNARDMLDAQIDGIQAGWNWVAQQRAARDLHDVISHPDVSHMRNASEYITKYYDNAFHRDAKGLDPIRGLIDGIARTTGQDPAPVYELLGLTRNAALVTTLGMSGGFILSQIVQVPQALVAATSYLRKYGVSANSYAAFYEGLHDFYAARGTKGQASTEGTFAYNYFEKHGTFDPHLLEKHIPRKVVDTAHMSPFSKALFDGMVNAPTWVIENYTKHLGHISIEMAETATRGTYAMSMFHYLRRAGIEKAEAVRMADKITSQFFVDYNPHERAMVWSKLGELGKFASTVTSYKMNMLNQQATFLSNKAYKTFGASMLVLVGLSGISGLPGFEELETIFGAMKRFISPDIKTPMETLITDAPDALTFGVAASMTDTNLQTKFSQSNLLPDDISSFLFPLGRIVYNIGESVIDAASNPNKETIGRALWEIAPGGAKAIPEKGFFTDKEGLTLNPRLAGKGQYENAGIGVRSNADIVKRSFGLTSLDEAKAKHLQFMDRRHKEIVNKRLSSTLTKAVQSVAVGDTGKLQEHLSTYFSEGGTEEALKNKLNSAMVGRNTGIKERMLSSIKSGNLRQAVDAKRLLELLGEKNEPVRAVQ